MIKNILITGGAGFIGSNLARYFQDNYPSYKITIFDIFNDGSKLRNGNNKFLGNFQNIIFFRGKLICGDICNNSDLELLNEKYDIIFHLAAISDTRVEEQHLIIKNNVNSFYFFLEKAKCDGSKLVYASSASVYGSSLKKKLSLGDEKPDNAYAYSKYSMDCHAMSLINSCSGIKLVGLRYFNVYGFGENSKGKTASTILQFGNQILQGKNPVLFENSDKIYRDFVYIEDVIQATVNAGLSDRNGIFNVGSGVSRSFFDVVNVIQNELRTNRKIDFIKNPYTSGYQYFTEADISETTDSLGYLPKYTLESGIADYFKKMKFYGL